MQNAESWRPTKFVSTAKGLKASRDPKQVAIESRATADIVAANYERSLAAHAAGSLLDLGCGYVPLYATYRDRVISTICADWTNTLHKNVYLDLVIDLNENLPFEDKSFDTVLLTDVLEHIAQPMQLMSEAARVLRPNGKLILGVPFLYWLHEEPHDYFRYTEYALRRFCRLNSLTLLELYPYGGFPEVLVDLTSKALGVISPRFLLLTRVIQWAGSFISRSYLGRKISTFSARQFPLGYLLVAERPS